MSGRRGEGDMNLILITCFVLTFCGVVSSQSSCRGQGELLLSRNAEINTELRNLDNVKIAKFENARSLPLELEHVKDIKKVDIFKSPNARCSWFRGWINVIVVINNIRCEEGKRKTSTIRPPKSSKPLLVKTTKPSSSTIFPSSSSTTVITSSTSPTTSDSQPPRGFHSPGTLITLQLSEMILIIVGFILLSLFLVAFGFHLCLKQQRHMTYCRFFSRCCKEKKSHKENMKDVKFKNTSFVIGDNESLNSSDVIFEQPVPKHPVRQRTSRTPSPARFHID